MPYGLPSGIRPTVNRVAFVIVLSLSGDSFGWRPASSPWDQLVLDADFLGVVRCVVPSGRVSQYLVLESWRGPPAGSLVRLSVDWDSGYPWTGAESLFPVTLAGKEFVVAAFEAHPCDYAPALARALDPWSNPCADYSLPQDSSRSHSFSPYVEIGELLIPLPSLRARTHELLGYSADGLELVLLRRAIRGVIGKSETPEAVDAAWTTEQLLRIIARSDPKRVRLALEKFSGPIARQIIDQTWREPRLAKLRDEVLWGTRMRRLRGRPFPRRSVRATPTAAERRRHLEVLLEPDAALFEVRAAVEALSRSDPAAVARFLQNFDPRRHSFFAWGMARTACIPDPRSIPVYFASDSGEVERGLPDPSPNLGLATHVCHADAGFDLALSFGLGCIPGCEGLLVATSSSSDAWVRVASAAFLALIGDARATRALERIAESQSLSGLWAAFELARRGDTTLIPPLLTLYEPRKHRVLESELDRRAADLRARTLLLLSNSAAEFGVPQPPESAARLREWWARYADLLRMRDPWLGGSGAWTEPTR